MRTAVPLAALALVVLTSATAPAVAHATVKDPTPEPTHSVTDRAGVGGLSVETVSYGRHRRQSMDVMWTPDGIRRPGVFVIHGGWWSAGDKRQATQIARSYADLGYTVFNLNYRLSGDAPWPAQRTDVLAAIGTAVKHAARWSFDSSNYVILGFSAGGHLAASAGTYGDGRLPGLKGVVGVSPVLSPLLAYRDGENSLDPYRRKLREAAIQLAGGCEPAGKCARIWASMEVAWHASRRDAPMLTVHSQDEFVPPAHSQVVKNMLTQVGVPMTVVTEPGVAHSAPLYRTLGVAELIQTWISERIG
ncbi:alpha/beta hydrolase [Thermoactinospora rubra]|uniref:alpha/beta hydrolase n=1 Tax=Thermoactinospora rubra TaxID=1088767 RepID=UPI000A0F431E|nr:alpha/beta hydrolase [Thermoactinospora rubra]